MDTYTVEFRIEGSLLVPSEVTKILGLHPCHTSDIKTVKNKKKYRKPFWSYDGISSENNFIEQEWNSLEDGLLFLLEKLLPKSELIRSQFDEYRTYWWCGFFQQSFNGGPTFSPNLLKKLADFGAELIIRNYRHDT